MTQSFQPNAVPFSQCFPPQESPYDRETPWGAEACAPYRVLSLTGGGFLGVISAAMLERYETLGRERYGADYRLHMSFDLVGGTSTGAVLATALSLGMTAKEMVGFYLEEAPSGFARRRFYIPGVTGVFNEDKLFSHYIAATQGKTLHRAELATDLAVVVKSMTSGQAVLATSLRMPGGCGSDVLSARVSSAPVCLADLLMATTAVIGLFSPKTLPIGGAGDPEICVDGGLSPYNDPAQLLYTAARKLQAAGGASGQGVDLVSIGTGAHRVAYSCKRLRRTTSLGMSFLAMRSMIADTVRHTKCAMRALNDDPNVPLRYRDHDMAITERTFELLGRSVSKQGLRDMRSFLSLKGKHELYEAACEVAEKAILEPLELTSEAALKGDRSGATLC